MPISKQTSMDIALAWREIDTVETLLTEIKEASSRRDAPDIRDAFGRHQDGLQLCVPSGQTSHRLFNVPWSLCAPIIEAHIVKQKALLNLLSAKALIEAEAEASSHV
jgi:hypothetical protein